MSRAETLKQIEHLLDEARKAFPKKERANRYVELARGLAMKANIRLPSELKRRFCRHCHSFLVPGRNLTVRTSEGKLVYSCHECKRHWRMPLRG
jgi:ribonuclease P protein subunit RPR2